jgi:hypothetical protein
MQCHYGRGFERSEPPGHESDGAKKAGDHEAREHAAGRAVRSKRANENPHGRHVAKHNRELARTGLKEQSRAARELRIRLLDEIDRGAQRTEAGESSRKGCSATPREREDPDAEPDTETKNSRETSTMSALASPRIALALGISARLDT